MAPRRPCLARGWVEVDHKIVKRAWVSLLPSFPRLLSGEVCLWSQLREKSFSYICKLRLMCIWYLGVWHLEPTFGNSHGLKFCRLELYWKPWVLAELYFQNSWHSVLRPRPQMSVCHIASCINGLVFTSGIWIYKVQQNPKISWEVPRFQKQTITNFCLEFNK